MLTSGRIFLETKRLNQENIVGFEYSGRDSRFIQIHLLIIILTICYQR